MTETGAQLPYDYPIYVGISHHVTNGAVVCLRRSDLNWSQMLLETFYTRILATHGDHDHPLAFIVELVDNVTPIALPKRLASGDVDHARPTKQRKTSTAKVLSVERIGDSRVLKTAGSKLQLPSPSHHFTSLFKLPGCLIVDGTSAIAALEDHAKTRTQDGFWGLAEFYNLWPSIPYEDSYAHSDIHKRPDLMHCNQSSLVLILNLTAIKPQADFGALYAEISYFLTLQLEKFVRNYSERFFSNAKLELDGLQAHEALDAVLKLVNKHGLTVFLGFLEYDLLALQTWMDYTLGLLPSLPPLDVIYHAKTCFLRIHNVIQVYRQGPSPTITRALYVGSSNSFAYALGSALDLEDMPELASSVAMTAQDVEACLRHCLPSSRHSEVDDYLRTIKSIAGGYCFVADPPPDCRDLFRPQDVMSCLTLVQKSKDLAKHAPLSDRQNDYHAQLRVLKSLLHISSTEDRNEVVTLLVGHVIEMSDTTLRYNVDVPVLQAAADDTNAAFRQYVGSTNQAAQKLMVTLGLVTFQPEESEICDTGVSACAIPNYALSSRLSADLRADAVTSEHLTKFDGTKTWFTCLLSNWSARHCDSIRTIEKVPEAVLQNTLELYVNMSSGITVVGPTPDRAICEVQLIANKNTNWKNFADIVVLPRAQEKGETDSEFQQDPTHLLLFIIELKSIQLYYLFWGTFSFPPTGKDLIKFRDRLLGLKRLVGKLSSIVLAQPRQT
ncbi:hypothetical protein BDZ89DRAFT_1118428 [Hymenopellis radicata]|nr:hypothetical protein BDZ89DRAFT_1118428 [Hymenopellis radicata]